MNSYTNDIKLTVVVPLDSVAASPTSCLISQASFEMTCKQIHKDFFHTCVPMTLQKCIKKTKTKISNGLVNREHVRYHMSMISHCQYSQKFNWLAQIKYYLRRETREKQLFGLVMVNKGPLSVPLIFCGG